MKGHYFTRSQESPSLYGFVHIRQVLGYCLTQQVVNTPDLDCLFCLLSPRTPLESYELQLPPFFVQQRNSLFVIHMYELVFSLKIVNAIYRQCSCWQCFQALTHPNSCPTSLSCTTLVTALVSRSAIICLVSMYTTEICKPCTNSRTK